MKVVEERINNVLVARVQETRLDTSISSEMKTELLRLVEAEGVSNVLLDLAKVEYADSSGLGALLFGHRQANAHSGKLKLLNLNPKVQTLMRIAKLETILECFQDEEVALKSF